MPHVINGSAANGVPTALTMPSDGDDFAAASIEVPVQGVLDGVTYLKAQSDDYHAKFDRARLLNWNGNAVAIANVYCAACTPGRLFMASDNGLQLVASGDLGMTGATANLVSSVSAGETIRDIAFDQNGNVVAVTNSRYVFDVSFNNLVAAKRDVLGVAASINASVVFLPALGKWLLVGSAAGGGSTQYIYTSTDRATWSASGLNNPFAAAASNGMRIAANPAGVVLAIQCMTSSSFRAATTSNAGATAWSSAVTVSGLSSVPFDAWITWDAPRSRWVVVLYSSAGNGADVFTSPDGSAWTKQVSLNNRIGRIAIDVDGTYVACVTSTSTFNAGLVASFDGGATWYSLNVKTPNAAQAYGHALTTPGGLVVVASDASSTKVYASLQTGNPALAAVI